MAFLNLKGLVLSARLALNGLPNRQHGRSTAKTLQLRPRQSHSPLGQVCQVSALNQRSPAGVNLQDDEPGGEIRQWQFDHKVEPARTEERRVNNVGSVRGAKDDDSP